MEQQLFIIMYVIVALITYGVFVVMLYKDEKFKYDFEMAGWLKSLGMVLLISVASSLWPIVYIIGCFAYCQKSLKEEKAKEV